MPDRWAASLTPPTSLTHGVLFDVGYTLLDETRRLDAAFDWLAAQDDPLLAGASASQLRERYMRTCAAPDPDTPSLFVQMMRQMGASAAQARELRGRMVWDRVPLDPYPDALDALRSLRTAGLRLGVLANQPTSAEADLRAAKLWPLLDGVWLSEALGLAKPDPRFFELALEAWDLPPHRVAYVGDRPDNDVRPARALGLHTVLLKVGPHACQPPRDERERPDAEAANLTQAAAHLRRWGAGDEKPPRR